MKARIENNVAVDVHATPETAFHPDIASQFEDVPNEVKRGWSHDDAGNWAAPPLPDTEAPETKTFRTEVNRIEFKTLFTIEEHVKIKMARAYSGDDMDQTIFKYTLDAAYDMLDDAQLSVIDLSSETITQFMGALVQAEILTNERMTGILQGVEA